MPCSAFLFSRGGGAVATPSRGCAGRIACSSVGHVGARSSSPPPHAIPAVLGEVAQAPHGEFVPAAGVFGDDDASPESLSARRVACVEGA